jgi:hypothetical protein
MTDPVQLRPVSDDTRERCGKCAYFLDQGQTGLCRRNPPQTFIIGGQTMMGQSQAITQSFFPPVTPEGWCGEFSPRSVEKVVHGDGSENNPYFIHPDSAGPLNPAQQSLDPVVVDRPEEPLPDPSGGGQDAA